MVAFRARYTAPVYWPTIPLLAETDAVLVRPIELSSKLTDVESRDYSRRSFRTTLSVNIVTSTLPVCIDGIFPNIENKLFRS